MKNMIFSEGEVIEYTNAGAAIASGDVVVISGQIGIASVDIGTGETGSVRMEGVFECAKAANAINQGEKLLWDVSASVFDNSAAVPAAGDISGCAVAWKAALAGDATVWVKINVGVGTIN